MEPIQNATSGAGGAPKKERNFSYTYRKNLNCLIQKQFFFFFFNKFIYLFIYFWLCWVFGAVRRLSLVAASGGYSLLWCAGFSLRWLLLLHSTGSRCTGFSSCGTWAQ